MTAQNASAKEENKLATSVPRAAEILDVGLDKFYDSMRAGEVLSYLDGATRKRSRVHPRLSRPQARNLKSLKRVSPAHATGRDLTPTLASEFVERTARPNEDARYRTRRDTRG
jgi:hypothetical protein